MMKFSGGAIKGPIGVVRPGSEGERTGLGPRTGVVEKWNWRGRCISLFLFSSIFPNLFWQKASTGGMREWYLDTIDGYDIYTWRFVEDFA